MMVVTDQSQILGRSLGVTGKRGLAGVTLPGIVKATTFEKMEP